MFASWTRPLALAAAVVAMGLITPPSSLAQSYTYPSTNPDLLYNFYVGPSQHVGGSVAQLYVAPRPTPPLVGHTYVTYQPLMPHEFLYKHRRTYYRHHPGSGMTRTRERSSSRAVRSIASATSIDASRSPLYRSEWHSVTRSTSRSCD